MNPLLEDDDEDDDESDDDEDAPGVDEEDETEDDADEQDHEPWVVAPCNDAERTLAATIIPSDVEANEQVYTDNPGNCGFCGYELDWRGFFVDGCLRGQVAWGNMCAGCFATKGAGIGWGKAQLYARQPDGSWRMVAGFA